MEKLGLKRDIDLALHLPLRYEDETQITRLSDARDGDTVQIEGQVTHSEISLRPRRQLRVTVDDGSDTCVLRFLNFYPSHQKTLSVGAHVRVRGDGTRVPLQALRGRRILALAGIARPHAFFQMLQACGVAPVATQALPDHYDFSSWSWPSDDGIEVICTEKDALKLWPKHPEVWAVPLELTPEPAFFEALDRRLDATLSSRHGHQTS